MARRRPKLKKDPFEKEKSSLRLSKRNVRRLRKQYLGYFASAVALVAIFAAGYYFLVSLPAKKSDPAKQRYEIGSFEDILQNGTRDQLINEFTKLEKTGVANLPVLIGSYRKRLQIADRMISNPEQATADLGREYKLRVLSQWDYTNVVQNFVDEEVRNQLLTCAAESVDSDNMQLRAVARLAESIVGVYEYPDKKDEAEYEAAKQKFIATADLIAENSNDNAMARVMIRTCEYLNSRQCTKKANELLQKIADSLSKAKDPKVASLAESARRQYLTQAFDLDSMSANYQLNPRETTDKMVATIEEIAGKNQLFVEEVETMMLLTSMLLQRQELDAVRRVLPVVRPKVDLQPKDSILRTQIQALTQHLSQLQQPFDVSALTDAAGKPFTTRGDTVKLIVFWKDEDKSTDALRNLHRQTGLLRVEEIDPIAVYVTDDGELYPFEKKSKDLLQISFYWIHSKKDPGKKLLEKMPIPRYPFLVILDENNKIQSINPSADIMRKTLDRLVLDLRDKKTAN